MAQQNKRYLCQIFGLLCCLILAGSWLSTPAFADLPPRPPIQDDDDEQERRPVVAAIVLQTMPAPSDLWSVVQWHDEQGGWHDIENWRGSVVNGRTIWWVLEQDFGKGPYRWLVFDQEGGNLLATSDTFNFPSEPKEQLVVEVVLP